MSDPIPTELRVRTVSRELVISFDDGNEFTLPAEYLRVFSPSAEVRGHGKGQEILQIGKELVNITKVDPVGNYAVRIVFDDGHDSGLFTWTYLHELGVKKDCKWQDYLRRLANAGVQRRKPPPAEP